MPLKTGGTRRQVRRAAKAAYPGYRIRTRIPKSPKAIARLRERVAEHPRKTVLATPVHRKKSGEVIMRTGIGDYQRPHTESVYVIGKKKKYKGPRIYRNVRTLGPSHGTNR